MTTSPRLHYRATVYASRTACGRYARAGIDFTSVTAAPAAVTCRACRKAMGPAPAVETSDLTITRQLERAERNNPGGELATYLRGQLRAAQAPVSGSSS